MSEGELLGRARIVALLTELGRRLDRQGVHAEIYVVGGGAMALAYNRERVTRDAASRGTYGARRVRAALLYERGVVVNRKLVRKLMTQAGLAGLPCRKKGRRNLARVATHEDLVNRNFTAASPNRLWLTDVTEHNTREGTLYCCAVLDLYSRRVVAGGAR